MTAKLYQAKLSGALIQADTITATQLATGSVGTGEILDATIALADISQAALMTLAAANPIHNGGFNVWQRGTSFVAAASGYTADRWYYLNIAAVVHTVQRSTDVPTVAALVPLSSYSLHLDVTTADAAIAAGDVCTFTQRIEGYAWAPFAQQIWTLGFWVKDTITGAHAVSLTNAGGDRACVMEYTVSVADTWEYKTATFPASPSAGTWDYTTGVGAYLNFTQAAGSTYQTTAGAWQTGEFHATASTVNSLSSTSNNFKLWGVTMGLGTTVAPFWPRAYGEELARCLRYYEVFGGSSLPFEYVAVGVSTSATATNAVMKYLPKRADPTISVSAAADFTVQGGVSTGACSAISSFGANAHGHSLLVLTHASHGGAAGGAAYLTPNTANARMHISADL